MRWGMCRMWICRTLMLLITSLCSKHFCSPWSVLGLAVILHSTGRKMGKCIGGAVLQAFYCKSVPLVSPIPILKVLTYFHDTGNWLDLMGEVCFTVFTYWWVLQRHLQICRSQQLNCIFLSWNFAWNADQSVLSYKIFIFAWVWLLAFWMSEAHVCT